MSTAEASFSGTGLSLLSSSETTNNNSSNNNNNITESNLLNLNSTNTTPTDSTASTVTASIKPSSGDSINNMSTTSSSSSSATTGGVNSNNNDNSNVKNNKDSINANDDRKDGTDDKKDESMFECNICLDTAKDAVVSMCGHLFCWPCLHQWLETRPTRKLCPVCKAAISKEKVIPLYGRNSTKQEDPRNKVPPRPAGQRTEPEQAPGFQGFGFGDGGFHMSFGIGAFPFGYFASSFNFGEPRGGNAQRPQAAQYEEEQHLSKVFLYLAVICIGWLLFA